MSAMTAKQQEVPGGLKEQIKSLLSAGCRPGQVAAAVGCEDSYVSQLMQDQQFSQEVVTARILALSGHSERDKKYDGLEDQILDKLTNQLHMIMNPDRLVRMLVAVNNAKRRGAGAADTQLAPISNVINLTLPTLIVNKYQTNQANEVVEVNGQGLVGMPATALIERLRASSKVREAEGPDNRTNSNTGTINTMTAQIPVTKITEKSEGTVDNESRQAQQRQRVAERTVRAGEEY